MSCINLRNSHIHIQEPSSEEQHAEILTPFSPQDVHTRVGSGAPNIFTHAPSGPSLKINSLTKNEQQSSQNHSQEAAVDHLEVLANKNHSSILLKKSLLSSGTALLPLNAQADANKAKRPKDIINAMKSLSVNDPSKRLGVAKDSFGGEKGGSVDLRANVEKLMLEEEENSRARLEEDGSGKEDEEDNLPTCPRHMNKKAKYHVLNNERELFCSKCAITIALKGEKITEILTSDERKRKKETEKFLSKLNDVKKDNQLLNEDLGGQGEKMEKYFLSLTLRVNNIYDMMERAIKAQRGQVLESVNSTLTENLKRLSELQDKSQRSKAQIEKFCCDIENNFDNIIRDVEMGPFNDIISKYKQKLESIKADIRLMRESSSLTFLKVDETSGLLRAIEAGKLPNLIGFVSAISKLGPAETHFEEASQAGGCEVSASKRRSLSSDFNSDGFCLLKNSQDPKQSVKPPLQQHLVRVQSQNIDTKAYRKISMDKESEIDGFLGGNKCQSAKGNINLQDGGSGEIFKDASLLPNPPLIRNEGFHIKRESADFSGPKNEVACSPPAKQPAYCNPDKNARSRPGVQFTCDQAPVQSGVPRLNEGAICALRPGEGMSHGPRVTEGAACGPRFIEGASCTPKPSEGTNCPPRPNEGAFCKNESKFHETGQHKSDGAVCIKQAVAAESKRAFEEMNSEEGQNHVFGKIKQAGAKKFFTGFHHQSPRKDEHGGASEENYFGKMRESAHFKQSIHPQGSCKKNNNSSSKDKDREKSSDSVYTSILKNLNPKVASNSNANAISNVSANAPSGGSISKKSLLLNMISPQSKRNPPVGQGKFFSNEKSKENAKLTDAFSRKQPLIDKENFDLLLKGK